MIIKLKKFLLFGIQNEIDRFFKKAQKQGFLEFISKESTSKLDSKEVDDLQRALKILQKEPQSTPSSEKINPEITAESIVEINTEIQKLTTEIRKLENEINRILPLGDFSIEDLQTIKEESGYNFQFFCRKTEKKSHANGDNTILAPLEAPFPQELIYLSTEYDLDYFLLIAKERAIFPSFIEMEVSRSLGNLRNDLAEAKKKLKELELQLKSYAKFLPNLQNALKKHLNTHHLAEAKKSVSFPINQPIFVVQAWIPSNKLAHLKKMLEPFDIAFEEIGIEKGDRVPTCFENKGFSRIGEDLVSVYDIPDPSDKDPSFWVFFFFAVFYAVIVGDGGYGFIYLALFLGLHFGIKQKTSALKRITKLVGVLSFTCITWGVLTASYFGLNLSQESTFRKISMIQVLADKKAEYHLSQKDDVYDEWVKNFPQVKSTDTPTEFFSKTTKIKDGRSSFESLDEFYNNVLLEVSLLFGIIHIGLGLIRYFKRSWAGIGWVLFMIGGYLFFPFMVNATTMVNYLNIIDKSTAYSIGPYILYGGIILAVALGFIQHRLSGLSEIMNVIQVFADVLSYLRLYALGLASMIMAGTFNMLASDKNIIIAFFILLAGHAVNIVLGIMGGVIHSLRLNFLEWYHWCFEGEGKLFNPLRKI